MTKSDSVEKADAPLSGNTASRNSLLLPGFIANAVFCRILKQWLSGQS
jgi:hypothetical protein